MKIKKFSKKVSKNLTQIQIIDEEKWNESQEFLKKIGYSNVTGKLYKNLRHEILNEKNKQQIYEDIINFI